MSDRAKLAAMMAGAFVIEALPQMPDFHRLPRWKTEQANHPQNPKKRAKVKAARKQNRSRK